MRYTLLIFSAFLFISASSQDVFPAEPGNAIQFNGSSGFASVNVVPPTGSVTLMGWFSPNILNNPSSSFGNQGLFGYRSSFNFYMLMLPNGRVEYRATFGNVSVNVVSTESACVGGWSHAALVYNQEAGTVTAYFNGLEVSTVSAGNSNLPQVNDAFRLARQQFSAQNYWFNGRMDNIAMINRALSQEELLEYTFQDIDDDEDDLVLYYKMNQIEGNSIMGNVGANMSLSGGYSWVASDFAVTIPEGSSAFVETPDDNGVVASETPFEFVIYGATFNADLGDDLITTEKAVVVNLPVGLEASLEVIDSTTALLTFSGSAEENDVSDSEFDAILQLLPGALNEQCGFLGWPISFEFIECTSTGAEITSDVDGVCSGAEVTLTASGGINYLWGDGSEDSEITLTPNETSTYTVSVTTVEGCNPIELSLSIEVFEPGEISIDAAPSTVICEGESVTLTASGDFVSYQWSSGEEEGMITVDIPGEFSVTGMAANGCEAQSELVIVEASEPPNYMFTGEMIPTEFTEHTYNLIGGGFTVEWEVEGGSVISETATQIVVAWGIAGQGSITFTITNEDGCINEPFTVNISIGIDISVIERSRVQINVYPNPASEVLTLEGANLQIGQTYLIYDSSGRQVEQFILNGTTHRLGVSHLLPGLYFIFNETKSWCIRFSVQH